MNRRDFLKTFGIVAGGGYLLSNRSLDVRSGPEQPNVLFIAIDDLNDWMGCMGGHPDAKTPNFDRLAARSVMFTNAHCSAPVCNPSRASLMTGIRPSTSGVYMNAHNWREAMPDIQTIPQYFMAGGYYALGRGKIYHHHWPDSHVYAWDEYVYRTPDRPPDKTHPRYMNIGDLEWGPIIGVEADMDDYQIASWGALQLERDFDKPFFLACGFYKPHQKWFIPEKYFDMFDPDSVALPVVNENDMDDIPPQGIEWANPDYRYKTIKEAGAWGDGVAAYLATVAFVDTQLGRLLDALDASKYSSNTIIVLWSDHGWHLGEKLHWAKNTLWEEATKAPLFVSVPGMTRPGSKCSRPVSFLDIYPTLVDLCSLEPKKDLEGKSFVPLLKNPKAQWDKPVVTTKRRNNHTIRSERWRYTRYADGTEELYDSANDPLEWTNLLWPASPDPEHRAIADDLAKSLPKVNN